VIGIDFEIRPPGEFFVGAGIAERLPAGDDFAFFNLEARQFGMGCRNGHDKYEEGEDVLFCSHG